MRTVLCCVCAGVAFLGFATFDPSAGPAHAQALTKNGDLSADAAFTCDLTLPGSIIVDSPEPISGILERDRMLMARRAGMLRKHIPLSIDSQTGNLRAGGRYLFDTEEHAEQYHRFVERFTLDGIAFLERPYFLDHECHAWSAIGARDFSDVHTSHVVMRTERWRVPHANQRKLLTERWPAIRSQAARRDFTSVWLLYNKEERLVSLVYFMDRLVPKDPVSPDFATLTALQAASPLGELLDGLNYARVFDRTQWSWTIWFPVLAGDHGEPSVWPNSPPLPEPFSGDGVCSVSRGETHANSPADCGPTCGDDICQRGETTASCPGDCGVK
jgi:hypothetical protein